MDVDPTVRRPRMIVEYNINETVEIQLTASGRQRLADQIPYAYPVDPDGWICLQLHQVMHLFGADLVAHRYGEQLPFRPTIRLHLPDPSGGRGRLSDGPSEPGDAR